MLIFGAFYRLKLSAGGRKIMRDIRVWNTHFGCGPNFCVAGEMHFFMEKAIYVANSEYF